MHAKQASRKSRISLVRASGLWGWGGALFLGVGSPGAATPPVDAVTTAIRCAPVLRFHTAEPFRLLDVTAVLHPARPLMAYHLFWEDDIAYPEDGEPSDHEIIWIEFQRAPVRPVRVYTYWHRLVLQDTVRGPRPQVNVQWGRHGTFPPGWGRRWAWVARAMAWGHFLLDRRCCFNNIPETGAWPARFAGPWGAYVQFDRRLDTRIGIRPSGVLITESPIPALERTRPYAFREKYPWP